MSRRGLSFLAVACAPALAACSLLLGEGFTDSDANPANDAGATTPDSSTNTGGEDGSSTDGGEGDGSDGSTPPGDASPDADGGGTLPDAGSVCPTGAVSFCDDFNRAPVKGAWDTVLLSGGGSLAIASGRLESAIGASVGDAQLSKSFNVTPQKLHFELTVEIGSLAASGGVWLVGVTMMNGSNPPALVYLYVHQNAVYFVEQVADGVGYMASAVAISTGAPHRVVIDVTIGGKSVVTVDGAKKIDKDAEAFLFGKPPVLYLGAGSIEGNGRGVSTKIDDFVFTVN